MSDLIDDPTLGENAPEFSVSDLSGAIKRMIEGEFSHVRVRGEVGRVSRPRSGHVYLDLKDDRSVLAGIIWKGVASRLAVQPEEGMEVVATGRLTTFPGQSRYQIVIEDMKPAGMGALMAMLEKRKAQLAGEGLFDPTRKQPIPYLPEIIGVITSPSGAVIRDILHRLRDRFPRKVLIWPVAVQGEKCAPEVTNAIRGFNAFTPGGALPRPDLLIVARGGGSIEDLWGFNEESVVRAAADSDIPLISAVGHETDTTLIDYASDKRAPTPTAAAELAVPVRLDLLSWLDAQSGRLTHALTSGISLRGQRLRDLSRALPRADTLLDTPRQRLDAWSDRLPAALIRSVQTRRVRLSESAGALRPGLLRRALDGDRHRLESTAARLNVPALCRDIDLKKRDLDRLAIRLSEVATRQMRGWHDQVESMDRLRETLGYKATLARGYAVVRGDGDLVTSKDAASQASSLEIEFADGRLSVGQAGTQARKAPKSKAPPPDQGSLF
ncbi:Exodeoxyribonuclease 7 large subunit [Roseovarius litorisediminis]|uniref:Exodeoxyribonuclease 7 large subunit n=1 Tax=Roseovarius litorisediminis TaxID=1312363 RepID=A0A1Y5S165_9RHOB|nr:exodeoxyribonuclease VII large subunit [Roseovarius litorisediminis]SLN30293.1 Exodeoxyribonuclease 7 large subunit [Roseovarius litorisediminis]